MGKKIAGALLLVLLILVIGGPFVAGMKAESQLHRIATKVSSYPGYEASWQSYDRGWFGAEGTLLVSVEDPAARELVGAELPLEVTLRHGPLLFGGHATLGWFSWQVHLAEEQSQWIEAHIEKAAGPLYQGQGHMNLVGTAHYQDELQPFSLDDAETGLYVKSEGYAGSASVSAQGKLEYDGLLRNTDFAAQDALLALGSTSIRANGDLGRLHWDSFLYPMDFYVNMASLQVQGNGDAYKATNAEFEGVVEMPAEQNWFNLVMSMKLAEFVGPAVQINDASMTFAYERISIAAYEAYMQAMAANDTGGQPDIASHFTPEVMEEFFANGPAFVLRNLSFEMPQGQFEGDLALSLSEDFGVPGQMVNPLILLQGLVLKANAEIDRPLALYFARQSLRSQMGASEEGETAADQAELDATLDQMAEDTVAMLAAQGLLVEDGEDLRATLEFIEGQLMLNGAPMPLPLDLLFGGQ